MAKPKQQKGPKVDFQREEYVDLLPRWNQIRDCVAGAKQVKKRRDTYLPIPNAYDTSAENLARYNAYLARAVYYNVCGRTLAGMIGMVFSKDPSVKVPITLEPLTEDINGEGVSLEQQAKKALGHVVAYGRAGLLADFPALEKAASREDLNSGKVRASVTLFDPWDIINWRTRLVDGRMLLSLVVLSEKDVMDDDGFEQNWDEYYRVLRLDESNQYVSEIWYFDSDVNSFVQDSISTPLDNSGKPWNEIPFTFIGPTNNDSVPDLPPLYDLSELNIGHYRNSADLEHTSYQVGQPTTVLIGVDQQWVDQYFKGELKMGSNSVIPLGKGADAKLLQAEGNNLPLELMKLKESQMLAIGAKLIEPQTVQRTATDAKIENAAEVSVLGSSSKNVSLAYTMALQWAGRFTGIEGDILVELNTEFDAIAMTAQDRQQLLQEWMSHGISRTEYRENLRMAGVVKQTDEEAKAEIDSESLDFGINTPPPPADKTGGVNG